MTFCPGSGGIGSDSMKIGEARQLYRGQVEAYQEQKAVLSKRLGDLKSRMEVSEEEKERHAAEGVALELSIGALDAKQEEYQEYLNKLSDKYCAYWNAEVTRQQADAAEEYAQDMGKIMEVARRIMKGGTVPASDEKKLMEFSFELYQTAKNIGSIARQKDKEKYDSLWGEEEEKEYGDPEEAAEGAQAVAGAPEIVSAADTVAQAVQTE